MTAVVYSSGAAVDDAGSANSIFFGASSVTSGQGVYLWVSHNGSAPGLYKFRAVDGGTTYTPTTLGTWSTPGGDKTAIAYWKAPASITGVQFYVDLRDAGDTADVTVTGFDRGYSIVTAQHGTTPNGTIVTATGTGDTFTGASTTPGREALLWTLIVRDDLWYTVGGEIGTERIEGFKSTLVTQSVTTSAAVNEAGTISGAVGWLAITIPILPATTSSSAAPAFSGLSATLKSGTPNDVRVAFHSDISTSGLTVTVTATTPNQPTPVTSTSVTWSGNDGYVDFLDLGPGEPWSFTVTGDNGQTATFGAGDVTIRALSFTGFAYAPASYSETALRWLDPATGEAVTSVTVAAGSTVAAPPYLAVTLLTGDVMAKDGNTPVSSNTGNVTVGTTGTDGKATITGVAAGTATITATSGTRTAVLNVTVTAAGAVVTPTWVTSSIDTFVVGQAGEFRLEATNAVLYSADVLPSGATLSGAGLLSWTPGSATSASVTFTATSSTGGTATRTMTVQSAVSAPPDIDTTSPLPSGKVGDLYSTLFVAIGTGTSVVLTTEDGQTITIEAGDPIATEGTSGSVTWSATGVPAGLTFTSAGLLSGTPVIAGQYELQVSASNSDGTTTRSFLLKIDPADAPAATSSAWAFVLRGK